MKIVPFSFVLFIFTLIFAPLAFGTVEYWSIGLIEAVAPAALLMFCLSSFKSKNPSVQIPGLLPLLLLICWMAVQLIPLPPGLVKIIAPAIYSAYQPLFGLSDQSWLIPLTVHPWASLQELFRFSTYGLFFILTVQLLSRRDYLKKTVTITACLGTAIAVEAIVQKLTSPHAIYWFRTSSQTNFPFGPWVYCNHFAGFMAMIFPVVLALFLYYRPTYDDREPLRAKILALFTMPGTNKHLLFGFAAFLIGVSILLSASRGGIVTLCLTLVLFIFLSSHLAEQHRSRWAVFLILLMLLMISWLGSDTIIRKFADLWGSGGLNTSERLPVLLDSFRMFHKFFFTGSGFGTYEFTFPAYRNVPDETIIFDHAHNDYIELLTTGGLIGFLLTAWFVISIIMHAVKMLRKRHERYNRLLTVAALSAVIALLLHSVIDFQMYNGANGLYFFFFCGLAIAAANTRLHYQTRPTLLPAARVGQQLTTAALAISVLTGSLWYNTASFKARRTFAPIRTIYLNNNIPQQRLQKIYLQLATAARFDPLAPQYPFTMAQVSALLNKPDRSHNEYTKAATLNPLSGKYIQQLALTLQPDQTQTANMLLAHGINNEPLLPDRYLTYANWLIASNKKPQAMTVMHQALQKHPARAARLSSFIFLNNLTQKDITAMLPDNPQAWHATGVIMEKEGRQDEAEKYYRQALNYLDDYKEKIQPAYFSRLYRLYMQQQKNDNALTILRLGIQYLPDNASFHKLLGDYYRKQGITYRAVEEYRQALQLTPKDTLLRQLLEQMKRKKEENP